MDTLRPLILLDAQLSQQVRSIEKVTWLRPICVLLAHSGDSWFWLAGLALAVLLAPFDWKLRAGILMTGILITAVVTMAAKFTIRRQRPPGEWGEIYRSVDPHSFPSGHASRAVMLAVLSTIIFPPWIAILLLIWALLVALARVAMGVHYLSDVIAGGLLGAALGAILGIATSLALQSMSIVLL